MVDSPLWWHKAGLQQTATGYGRKLTTRYKVQFEGKLYRVYATCYSNVASHWFTVKGEKIFINWSEDKNHEKRYDTDAYHNSPWRQGFQAVLHPTRWPISAHHPPGSSPQGTRHTDAGWNGDTWTAFETKLLQIRLSELHCKSCDLKQRTLHGYPLDAHDIGENNWHFSLDISNALW